MTNPLTATRNRNDFIFNLVDHRRLNNRLAGGQDHAPPGLRVYGGHCLGAMGAIGGGCFARFVVRFYDSYYVADGAIEVMGTSLKAPILMAVLGAVALVCLSRVVSRAQKKQI
jgi:hypothetical protein